MFLIEMMQDMWNDDWIGKVLFFLMAGMMILVLLLVLWFLHWAVDSWFQDEQEGTGTVICKYFTPAHTTMTWISTGNSGFPIYNSIPDTWDVVFFVDGKQGSISVTQDFYNQTAENDRYRIKFREGRISDKLYVDDIL